jgi:hypothetical protein
MSEESRERPGRRCFGKPEDALGFASTGVFYVVFSCDFHRVVA